jgi:hypothetical protein
MDFIHVVVRLKVEEMASIVEIIVVGSLDLR